MSDGQDGVVASCVALLIKGYWAAAEDVPCCTGSCSA